jgi:hypothetical protein
MVEVNCPVDGCNYSGPVGSVEGHISASQSGGHEGEVGRHFREGLVEQAEGSISGDGATVPEVAESSDGSGADDHPGEGGGASSGGRSIPPGKAVVVSTLALLLLAFSDTTDADTEVEEQAGDQEAGGDPAGGLIDG